MSLLPSSFFKIIWTLNETNPIQTAGIKLKYKDFIPITGSAVLLIVSFAPFSFGFFAFAALIPLFWFISTHKPRQAFSGGYWFGLIWAIGTLYWIGKPTPGGMLGVLLVLPLYGGVFSWIQSWLVRQWGESAFWSAPLLWTGLEVISSLGQLAFPWNVLGNTQAQYPAWIQIASFTGVFGISFWLVLINVCLYLAIMKREPIGKRIHCAVTAFILLFGSFVYGKAVLSAPKPVNNTPIHIGFVQGNIDSYKKWTPSFIDSNMVIYSRLTRQLANSKPDLAVWPETAVPCYIRHRYEYLYWMHTLVDSLSFPVLTGAPDYDWDSSGRAESFNAALLFQPNSKRIQLYYKKQLVPFAEKVPFSESFPKLYNWLNRIVPDVGDYMRGDSTTVFSINSNSHQRIPFSAVICFESIFPNLVSRFVSRGAGFLVIITNDGWFGNTSGPFQHARVAALRAVENRRWIVRCANTGISGFVDPYGRMIQRTRLNQTGVMIESVQWIREKTFFTKHTDFLCWLCLACNGILLAVSLVKNRIDHRGKNIT